MGDGWMDTELASDTLIFVSSEVMLNWFECLIPSF